LRPFLGDRGLGLLYRRGEPLAKLVAAARAVGGRLRDTVDSLQADAVLVHREAALIGPPVFEWLMSDVAGRPLLFDFDDAVWVPYDSPTYGALLSRLLKMPSKTDYILRRAARVMAGNEYLADYARQLGCRVDVVPTVVDTEVFRPRRDRHSDTPVLGWIGTHSSARYLRGIVPALQRLARRRRFIVRVVGAAVDAPGVPIECAPWSLDEEIAEIQRFDVGLYPIVEDAWSRGKSGFKAVEYMACGVPVVASPVGVTVTMIDHGKNGFLARSTEEWIHHLEAVLDDLTLRRALGGRGRQDAVERWSLRAHAPRVVEIVTSVVQRASE
jgi:glycosyltransferase involved in cell wall biosynthesis